MNSRTVLRRFLRDHGSREGNQEVDQAARTITGQIEKAMTVKSLDALREWKVRQPARTTVFSIT